DPVATDLTAELDGSGSTRAQLERQQQQRILPASRYRRPGDVIHLIASVLLLLVAVVVVLLAPDQVLKSRTTMVSGVGPDSAAGRLIVGLLQITVVVATVAVLSALLHRRRFRLLAAL